MMRIFPFLLISFLYTLGFAQPILNFTPVTLTGPQLSQPVDITGCGDGSGRLFITEKRGTVRIVQNGAVLPDFFLDIQSQVMNSGERGLLGLAFHPQYPTSPYIYVNYVFTGSIITRISRFTLNPNDANDIDEGTELILITQPGVETNHKAGDLAFGPDGFLYIGMGDGGGGGDPDNNGQDLEILLAKILRIDVNTFAPPLNYSIPPNNPFLGGAGLDEIWAYGIRNPWRISFDRSTGDFWIADVGQNAWEEVNMVLAGTSGGMNFGWDCKEGNHNYQPGNCPDGTVFTYPIFEYPHTCNPCPVGYGASLTGGFVYRGNDYPVLQGCYVCADYVSNYLWMIKQTGSNPPTFDVFVQDGTGLVSGLVTFGEDDDGELYASNLGGTLYEVSASGFLPIQWQALSATLLPKEKGNKINWTIHQTFGVDHFEVERSAQSGFQDYISVAAVQPVQDQINYSYTDVYMHPLSVYYRIAAYMEDSSVEYSPVGRILPDPKSAPSLTYETITNIWRVTLPDPWRNGEVTLFDLQGKEVYKRQIASDEYVELSPPIIPGSYFVKINGEMGTWSEQVRW